MLDDRQQPKDDTRARLCQAGEICDKEQFKAAYLAKLQDIHGKGLEETGPHERYVALAALVRDRVAANWVATNREYLRQRIKQVYYFSIEFLLGRVLRSNLINTGLEDIAAKALADLGLDIAKLEEQEEDAGLGSGGLGRLAACFLDSLASRHLAGHGCGIRYRHGMFKQQLLNGYQVEVPDQWLKNGNVWEVRKPDKAVKVHFGGSVRLEPTSTGSFHAVYDGGEDVLAVPYDMPIIGFNNKTVNTLRLWSAETVKPDFDFASFNRGDYHRAAAYRQEVEAITEILYPDDTNFQGKVLRLKQQYFFVSAGVQSIIRRFKKKQGDLHELPELVAIHINDTHPALVIPELMRILMDDEGMGWDEAWHITRSTVSYTNHTVLPEALEKWSVMTVQQLLPRIYMIINELNERFCRGLWAEYPGDWNRSAAMAIIADGYVHMARLAVIGSYSVNGVAKIHTEILKKDVMRLFYEYYPYKFNNKTNGITHRRWLIKANPGLTELLVERLGVSWVYHPADLLNLLQFASDPEVQERIRAVKLANKQQLAAFILARYGLAVDPHAVFDIQVKRIHAYKRQLLNAFHIMDTYNQLKADPGLDIVPRVYIFAGKAAPGYFFAKQTIKLINTLAELINNDPVVHDRLKVVFLENYSVSLAELVIPAADVSEQISTASKEASGTGNMKLMLNGAVTIGTLDGANIEIRDEVGPENFVSFGLTADEVLAYYQQGGYDARQVLAGDARLQRVVEQLTEGSLPIGCSELVGIVDQVLAGNDEFFVMKDFSSYLAAQQQLETLYRDEESWTRMCIANIAHAGRFSSDRTIKEYAIGIWNTKPIIIA